MAAAAAAAAAASGSGFGVPRGGGGGGGGITRIGHGECDVISSSVVCRLYNIVGQRL